MQDIDQIKSAVFLGNLRQWASELGFHGLSVGRIRLSEAENRLQEWLRRGYHGDMVYMEKHGIKRSRPDSLIPGTLRVISVIMNYYPEKDFHLAKILLQDTQKAYVSRYALGRDYHGLIRKKLQRLIDRLLEAVGPTYHFRAFSDSAPVMEKPLAQQAGLGWIGKHTNLINRQAGSWFFLGEIYTDLPLMEIDSQENDHCGDCEKCLAVCPTQAIVAPYVLDARRCISYLTIEYYGSIAPEYRPLMGNRIYGCDDCQLFCPWNRFAQQSPVTDFHPRHNLHDSLLLELFSWDENTFRKNTEGSPIRRIGFHRWQRNIAIALGNADYRPEIISTLRNNNNDDEIVKETIQWALEQQSHKKQ